MNLLLDYKNIFFKYLSNLQTKGTIKLPDNFKGLTVELPPKDNKADNKDNQPNAT